MQFYIRMQFTWFYQSNEFIDKRRKVDFSAPVIMPELQRVQVIKILGVILTNGLSVSLHVQTVITSCAQTLYALRVLWAHGLCQSALQNNLQSSRSGQTDVRIKRLVGLCRGR